MDPHNPQVFIYQHKPYALLPWRKRELSFTDYSLSELLVEGSNLEFATARKFLFDIDKGVETVDTTVGKFLINNYPLLWNQKRYTTYPKLKKKFFLKDRVTPFRLWVLVGSYACEIYCCLADSSDISVDCKLV